MPALSKLLQCWTCRAFSYFTFHKPPEAFCYKWSQMKAVEKFLMSYIKLCYGYVKFNEPIKVAHLQKLSNQSVLNGALSNGH